MKNGTECRPTIVAKTPKERRTSGKMIHSMSPGDGVDRDTEDHRADVLGRHGLEEVGATAGAVADVVTDQVGDDGSVSRVVFRDARLDLADKVGADVGGLGVDTAAKLGEQRHEAGAEAEADDQERRDRRRVAQDVAVDEEDRETPSRLSATTRKPETAPPRSDDRDRLLEAALCRSRGADVRPHGDVHTDVAGEAGAERADEERDAVS